MDPNHPTSHSGWCQMCDGVLRPLCISQPTRLFVFDRLLPGIVAVAPCCYCDDLVDSCFEEEMEESVLQFVVSCHVLHHLHVVSSARIQAETIDQL